MNSKVRSPGSIEGLPRQRRRYLLVVKNLKFLNSHFWPLVQAINQAGWDVWIAADQNADPRRIIEFGMKYISIPGADNLWDLAAQIRVATAINEVVRRVEPDIVHFIYIKNVLIGGIVARIHRVPAYLGAITGFGSLFSEQSTLYRILQWIVLGGLKIGFHHSNAVLALENRDDEQLLLEHGIAVTGRTHIVPGAGVEKSQRPLDMHSEIPTVLCTSRMLRHKGIVVLTEAARLLRERGINFELWLAGDVDPGNPHSLTVEDLRSAEEDPSVKWLGYKNDVYDLLARCWVFCLPSYYREGLPRSLVEAAAAGRAIVTTDMPGCRDVVISGVNGFLVPPKDAKALADALQSILTDDALCSAMGLESRRIFEERFTLDQVLASFTKCYRSLGIDLTLSE